MLCQIGEVEVWRILEINGPFRAPEELFPTAGPDVRALIETYEPGNLCEQTGKVILPIQGFLLRTPQHLVLVDACVGNDKTVKSHSDWHQRSTTRFISALTAAGAAPEDVDYVLCTHLHTDHIGWNTCLANDRWVPTFPNAKYILPADDRAMHIENDTDMYRESVLPVVEAGQAEFVSGEHSLGDFVKLLPTPGHTPGHVSVEITSGGNQAVITGDAIHITAQCQYPDWHFKYDFTPEQAVLSCRALLERASETGQKVIGTHFKLPSVGRVTAKGDRFSWEWD